MITEKSCGAIVFTAENNNIKYVIIRAKEGLYGFPKGHIEGTERRSRNPKSMWPTLKSHIFQTTSFAVQWITQRRPFFSATPKAIYPQKMISGDPSWGTGSRNRDICFTVGFTSSVYSLALFSA